MSGDVILVYWSHETIHYYSRCHNEYVISEEDRLEFSLVDVRRVHRSLDTSHSSSCNRGGCRSSDFGRVGYKSQDTRHSSSQNCVTRVDVEGRGLYRYQTRHASPHNPGDLGILLTSPFSSRRVDDNVHKK